ncbi:hypothetical protein K2173_010213 [Erythroxylum novogranatense]|uniref:Uncharacterized protein n=1 Tax=Erythroxylum novogranatense TaxID=1862640 RepID=A0AAV8U9E1_9ROSI|nr:hypothetical protein K2173_010213 [Erythroxylum novogranatense]
MDVYPFIITKGTILLLFFLLLPSISFCFLNNLHHISLDFRMRNLRTMSTYFLFILYLNFSLTTSTITIVSKDQISCTMCSSCDNPCQPLTSPPPPPPPDSSCPPPPPPAIVSDCPPTQTTPSSGGSYYYSPPPPSQQTYFYSSPPPPANGGAYFPPSSYGNAPPPPNPILPYFPFYYYNPPPSSFASNSFAKRKNPNPFSIFLLLCFLSLL